ncbi:hypothetical protein A3A46_04190 [Candidatus Roizmanbacteria bacterium RIFCSPLOWO2_01_FULL_37_13]|uniref:Pilus assembly protein PilO n=1 Tax=Candidatus Roizmanbacteria bacterium RIFCSPHIGHO2_02_FULL_38_11 TaxID=1802039 RepID=A0A1F7H2G1_9BACT|nr:MAG: hypothetical protein A3C25_03245 [Candidatus Roizmanbacteria bacterium RIFCSPHIGHO2_02_FULL_38_11]OGK34903.1 MAG: hypothetical protein A3F58_03700 [Candidatus Roizmanbacteria bacterium RIFCSPHIGHO2_12_FULL_37_9b]OGK40975.1 MAG: hypothetical protein A3A46_04190 [Candidatus Roizmanbacteria bacterium RIFCSPLOWO2_01_FULL_37_13]
MEKSSIVKKLYTKKTQDYTYTIAFFLIFSFFIFYIIRPNLLTVFETNSKIQQLDKINRAYEEQINKVIETQSVFEENREDFILLDQAIGPKPEINKMLSDVVVSTEESTLTSERIDVFDINLKDKDSIAKLKSFTINISMAGTFEDTMAFVKKVYGQRRLKLIPNLELARDKNESSPGANLKIKLQIEGYYL